MTTDNLPTPTFTGAELRARLDTSSTFLRQRNQEVRSLDSFAGAQGVAEGETVVNNRAVIQAAADWSHTTGGKVIVPPKVYGCDGDVQLKSYVTFEGVSKRMSKIRQLSNTAVTTFWTSNVAGERPAFITMDNFSIQGGRAPDWTTDNRDFTAPVVHIRGTLLGNGSYEPPDDPVALGREDVSFLADPHHRITNMVITDAWGDCLLVEGRGENVIVGNTLETSARHGLNMASPDNWIGMNTIFKTAQSGIFCNQSNQRFWSNKTWFYAMWAAEELFAAGLHFDGPGISQISVNGHHVQDGTGPGYRLEGVGLIIDGIVDKAAGGRVLSQGLGWQGAQTLRQSHVQVDNLKGSHVRLGFMNRGQGASPPTHIVNMNDSGADQNRIEIGSYGETFDTAAPIRVAGGFAASKTHNVVMHNGEMLMGHVTAADLADPTHTINTGDNRPSQVFLDTGRAALRVGDEWSLAPEGTVINPFDIGADTAPAQMAAPTLVADSTSQITATFAADPNDGGSPITGYDARYSTDESTWTTSIGATSPDVFTGLLASTQYFVQTRANNSVGNGPWSPSATVTTQVQDTAPSQMAAPSLTADSATQITATFAAAPSDNGSAITSYDARYSTDESTWITSVGATSPDVYTGLTAATNYFVQTRANNAVGSGPWSASASVATAASPGGQAPVSTGLAQINLSPFRDYESEQPYANLIRQSRFIPNFSDPSRDQYLCAWDQATDHTDLAGRYRCWWETGEVQAIAGRVTNVDTSTAGQIEFDFTPGAGGIQVELASGGATGIHVVKIDNIAAYESGDIYRPEWAAFMQGHATYRFMDWGATNFSTVVNFSDLPSISGETWATDTGAPLAAMVNLCNDFGVDMWYCVPHLATDAFVTSAMTYIRDNLDPRLQLKVEYSNEVWNVQFSQSDYFKGIATAELGDENRWMQVAGRRAAEVMNIASGVFSGEENRLIRVAGVQTDFESFSLEYLEAPLLTPGIAEPRLSFDHLAVALYLEGGYNYNAANWNALETQYNNEGANAAFQTLYDATLLDLQNEMIPQMTAWKTIADNWGMTLDMYEGNPMHHAPPVGNESQYAILFEYNLSPYMGDMMRQSVAAWEALNTGTGFNVFSAINDDRGFDLVRNTSVPATPRLQVFSAHNLGQALPTFTLPSVPGNPATTIPLNGQVAAIAHSMWWEPRGGNRVFAAESDANISVGDIGYFETTGGASAAGRFSDLTTQTSNGSVGSGYDGITGSAALATGEFDALVSVMGSQSGGGGGGFQTGQAEEDGLVGIYQAGIDNNPEIMCLLQFFWDNDFGASNWRADLVGDLADQESMRAAVETRIGQTLHKIPTTELAGLVYDEITNGNGYPGADVSDICRDSVHPGNIMRWAHGALVARLLHGNVIDVATLPIDPDSQITSHDFSSPAGEGRPVNITTAQRDFLAPLIEYVIVNGYDLSQTAGINGTATPTITVTSQPTLDGLGDITEGDTFADLTARLTNLGAATSSDSSPVTTSVTFTGISQGSPLGGSLTQVRFVYSATGADNVVVALPVDPARDVQAASVPATAPDAFGVADWSVEDDPATSGTVTVNISTLPANNGANIDRIDYRVDSGAWTDSGVITATTFDVTGLTDGVQVTVELRASNTEGDSPASDAKTVTSAVVGGGLDPENFIATDSSNRPGFFDVYPGPYDTITHAARYDYTDTPDYRQILQVGGRNILTKDPFAGSTLLRASTDSGEVNLTGTAPGRISVLVTSSATGALPGGAYSILQVKIDGGDIQTFTLTSPNTGDLTSTGIDTLSFAGYAFLPGVANGTFSDFFDESTNQMLQPPSQSGLLIYLLPTITAAQMNAVTGNNAGEGVDIPIIGTVVDAA